ncbi:MAG: hypothetical protein ACREPM_06345 [Gemmatimonadaceae bacterium]
MKRNLIAAAALSALLAGACDRYAGGRQRAQSGRYIAPDSMGARPRDIATIRLRKPAAELVENSAAAMSTSQPGVLFSVNDSGNEPLLFALDTTGANRGVWRVLGATNVDWESAAVAPCSTRDGASCVYIGDTGDNHGKHPFRVIYRVREPTASGVRDTVRAERLRYAYEDGPHDVEAMYVAPSGDIVLITKRPLAAGGGRLRPALVFSIARGAWTHKGIARAALVDSLPIIPGSAPLRLITDAALSPDAKHLAVRTYAQLYIFATDASSGAVNHGLAPSTCNLVALGEAQGEGVTWADNRGRLAFTSEGKQAPLRLATCPLP